MKGKVVIVTGASKGIGEATAQKFAENGATTYFVSRSGSEKKVSELKEKGLDAYSFKCDCADEAAVKSLVEAVVKRHSKIDVLVNDAGVVSGNKIEDITIRQWNEVVTNNLTTMFVMSKFVLPIMKQKRYGKIINISSIAGRYRSLLAGIDYVSSKAGVIGFTRQLSFEAAPFNINVNCVAPAQTDTEMLWSVLPKDSKKDFVKNIPIGRIAKPIDIANVIYFLAGDDSRQIAGAVIDVNGGQF